MDSPSLAEALVQLPLVLARFDDDGRVTHAAGGASHMMGMRTADIVGISLVSGHSHAPLARAVSRALAGEASSFAIFLEQRWWQCHVVATRSGGGSLVGTMALDVAVDATVGQERIVQALTRAPVCVTGFDTSATVTYAGGSGYAALGVDATGTVGRSVFDTWGESQPVADGVAAALAGRDCDVVTEHRGRVWHLHYRTMLEQGQVDGGYCTAEDVTEGAGEGAPAMTTHAADPKVDVLTGLMSRQAVSELIATGRTDDEAVAVLVDLDAFAVLNEAYGQAVGDTVLAAVGERLRTAAALDWEVGRWGDDVFALVRQGPGSLQECDALVRRVVSALSVPIEGGAAMLQVTASIGVAGTDASPVADLLGSAALAVRNAKQGGRDQVHRYTSRLARLATAPSRLGTELQGLATELRAGLEQGQIGLHYQPIVRLADRRATGVEALARWEHPERGLLMPVHFIPLAERSGLIVPLGERLVRQACHAAAAWQRTPPCEGPLRVAVNLSARQLVHPGLLAMVRNAITVSGCDPSGLAMEVTETALMDDLDAAVATLKSLREIGVGIALDDFGTGYSSLVYLKRFPVDTLKIDRSFVAGLGEDGDDTAIVASLISLAHSVGVACVAEGVETAEQLAILESLGCDHAQGYVFGRAQDPAGITAWLSRQRGGPARRRAPDVTPAAVDAVTLDRVRVLHGEGASLHTIAARLNVEGRRTAKGTRWHHATVAQIIASAIAPSAATSRARRDMPPR